MITIIESTSVGRTTIHLIECCDRQAEEYNMHYIVRCQSDTDVTWHAETGNDFLTMSKKFIDLVERIRAQVLLASLGFRLKKD